MTKLPRTQEAMGDQLSRCGEPARLFRPARLPCVLVSRNHTIHETTDDMNSSHHRSRLRGPLLHAGLAAALLLHAQAAPTAAPGFSATPYYIHPTGDSIVSYDWAGASGLYYMTLAGYPDVALWSTTGGAPTKIYGNPDNFAGDSVVTIGDYVYFNDSDLSNHQYIRRYGPVSGAAVTTLTSSAVNYGLYGHDGQLFITAKDGSAPANIFLSGLAADGHLLSDPPLSLGDPASGLGGGAGGSGPLAFDLAGNLYYAPGYSDTSIYKFAAHEVAEAIQLNGHPLKVTGHRWLDYGASDLMKDGASSMLIDADGDLLVTLSSLTLGDSLLVKFGVAPDGSYDNTATTMLTDAGRLGELRFHEGKLYVSEGNGIFEVVPEPRSFALLAGAAGVLAMRRRRRLAVAGAVIALAAGAQAGPYSTGLANTTAGAPDVGIPGFVGPAGAGILPTAKNGNVVNPLFVGWATSVVAYAPAPGVSTAFSHANLALGPVTGDNSSVVSLGDVPAGTTRPAPGTLTLGFARPITNGLGADFAAFENGFISDGESGVEGEISGELGYVEVSTDGVQFARFPSVSLTPGAVGAYGTIDSTNVYNLVGKHVNAFGDSWGTPFDLQDLASHPLVISGLVDLDRILYVRIVDIPGDGTFFDGMGHSIFDAWLTTGSGGVDFEALGVIHQIPEPRESGWMMLGLGSLLAARPRPA